MEEWSLDSVITTHNLVEKPSSKTLMGQVLGEMSLALQVEGQDITWITI